MFFEFEKFLMFSTLKLSNIVNVSNFSNNF